MAAGIYLVGEGLKVPEFRDYVIPRLEDASLSVRHFFGARTSGIGDYSLLAGVLGAAADSRELEAKIGTVLTSASTELERRHREDQFEEGWSIALQLCHSGYEHLETEEEGAERIGNTWVRRRFTPHIVPIGYFSDDGMLDETFALEVRRMQYAELEEKTEAFFKNIKKRTKAIGKALSEM